MSNPNEYDPNNPGYTTNMDGIDDDGSLQYVDSSVFFPPALETTSRPKDFFRDDQYMYGMKQRSASRKVSNAVCAATRTSGGMQRIAGLNCHAATVCPF